MNKKLFKNGPMLVFGAICKIPSAPASVSAPPLYSCLHLPLFSHCRLPTLILPKGKLAGEAPLSGPPDHTYVTDQELSEIGFLPYSSVGWQGDVTNSLTPPWPSNPIQIRRSKQSDPF